MKSFLSSSGGPPGWGLREVSWGHQGHLRGSPCVSSLQNEWRPRDPRASDTLKLRLSNTFLPEPFGFSNLPYKGPTDESRINQERQRRESQEQRGLLSWRSCRLCWSPACKQMQHISHCLDLGFPASPWGSSPQGSFWGLFSFSEKKAHMLTTVFKVAVFNIN